MKVELLVHKPLAGEGHYWSCEFPERPPEGSSTHYFTQCHSCLIALHAVMTTDAKFQPVNGDTLCPYTRESIWALVLERLGFG